MKKGPVSLPVSVPKTIKDIVEVTKALEELETETGSLMPQAVVARAEDPESPLHAHFTWDDTEAARKQRIEEARTLIKIVKVQVTTIKEVSYVCKYVRDPVPSGGKGMGYRHYIVVKNDSELWRATMVDEMRRVADAAGRARKLAALFEAEAGIEEAIEQIEEMARTVMKTFSS
jgi:hypothetical protein